jgi:cell division septal protein FtsQ
MSRRPRGLPPTEPPLVDLPLASADDAPFFRPKSRTRPRVARRGKTARIVLALEIGGAAVLLLGLASYGYARLMASDMLRVARVEVRGNSRLSEGEVRELVGPAVGENLLTVEIERLRERVIASPWVARANVRRSLPNTIEVEIRERAPLALAELDKLYLMDATGALIDMYGPQTAGFDLPIVRGLKELDGEACADRAGRAGRLLDDLGELASEVSEVEVEDSGDLRVVLKGAGEVVRLGAPPYRERLATFLRLRQQLAERCPRAEYFDLRFRSRIVAIEPPQADAAPVAGDSRVARGTVMGVIR